MGVDVGFEFYRYKNNKLEEANIINDDGYICNYLNICGRCDATYLFVNLIEQYEKEGSYRDDAKPEDKYVSYLLLNHPELNGLEDHSKEYEWEKWYKKYFYYSLEDFKSRFDFEGAQIEHLSSPFLQKFWGKFCVIFSYLLDSVLKHVSLNKIFDFE